MKLNPIARRIVNAEIILLVLAIAVIAGFEFGLGATLAGRVGQNYSAQTPGTVLAPSSLGLPDLMAAVAR